MLEQRLARPLLGDRRRRGEDRLEIAELRDQLTRRLVTDALHAGHVVRRVADEREIIHDVRRRHAESVAAVLDADPLLLDARRATAPWIEEPDAFAHELL